MATEYGKRLKAARNHAKLTQKQAGDLTGIAQSTISTAENLGNGSADTPIYAKAYGVNAHWLATGEGSMLEIQLTTETQSLGTDKHGNVDAARAYAGEVPVISWVQAGSWHEAADSFQPGEADRFLPVMRGHSTSTYALKVRGDSMTAVYGKSYPQGSYIIVDPAKLSPSNGDRIIAKLEGSDEVTFKVYKEEDGRKWLAPLNTSHLPIIEPFKVLGTVIGKWEDE